MIDDKWIPVLNDTKIHGQDVEEEVRPAPGKRQYVGEAPYVDDEEDEEDQKIEAPDATEYPPGRYRIDCGWVNVRKEPNTESPIIGRPKRDEEFNVISVKLFNTAVR